MRMKASASQRILAAIIDFAIVFLISYLVGLLIGLIWPGPAVPKIMQDFNDGLITSEAYLAWVSTQEFYDYSNAAMVASIPNLIFFIVLFISYFVIIPMFWKKQTLGRLAMKIQIVYDGEKPGAGTLMVREVVGVLLVGLLNCCCGLPLILNLVFLLGQDKTTIQDKIANTKMVCSDKYEEEDSYNGSRGQSEFAYQVPNQPEEVQVVDNDKKED